MRDAYQMIQQHANYENIVATVNAKNRGIGICGFVSDVGDNNQYQVSFKLNNQHNWTNISVDN